LHRYATKNDRIESNESETETETETKTNRIESKKISLGMLRSDLMLESGCPELSPRALRTTAGEDAAADVGKGAGTAAAGTGRKEEEKEEQKEHRENQLSRATKERERRATGIQSAYCCWKQVEINTIASGFGHLGPASKTIQRCCPHPQSINAATATPHHTTISNTP